MHKLFLLDGMALVYRAHFAFMRNPILTSSGMNTSAVLGFANVLLDIIENQDASHLASAFPRAVPCIPGRAYGGVSARGYHMPHVGDSRPGFR